MAISTRSPRRRVLLVLPSLSPGGSERVVVTLANSLDRSRFDIHLVTMTGTGDWTEQVAHDVSLCQLQASRELLGLWPLCRLIRRIRPNVVMVGAMRLNVALLAMRFLLPSGVRIIVREGNLLSLKMLETSQPWLWRWLVGKLYPRADRIIAQCNAMAADLADMTGIDVSRIVRIYNPVDIQRIDMLAADGENPYEQHPATPTIVAVGSFKVQKGFGRLLDSFKDGPAWLADARLWILGDGKLREELQEQAERLGISDRVHFPGIQENPFVWLRHADLFVLSSLYEGLPNVLLEAIVCRCPVAVWESPGGAREIMQACQLEGRLMHELTWERRLLDAEGSDEARARVGEIFGLRTILSQYEVEFAR